MVFIRWINRDVNGYRMYLPPPLIRELGWKPHEQVLIFVDDKARIIIDRITIERYPEFFQVSSEEFLHE